MLFEFSRDRPEELVGIVDNYRMMAASGFDVCILGSTERNCGYHREIHIWITPEDYDNASLMILLAFVILGHPDWKDGEIKLFATFPETEIEEERQELLGLIAAGRLPISANNVELIPAIPGTSRRDVIREKSRDADLVMLGFVAEILVHRKEQLFAGYDGLANILWVNTEKEIRIQPEDSVERAAEDPEMEPQDEPPPPPPPPARDGEAGPDPA